MHTFLLRTGSIFFDTRLDNFSFLLQDETSIKEIGFDSQLLNK